MLDDALRGFLQAGILIGGCSVATLLMLPRNSPEFVISLCSALIGLFLVLAVVGLKLWANRLPRMDEKDTDDSRNA